MNYPKISTPLRVACIILVSNHRAMVKLALKDWDSYDSHARGLNYGNRMACAGIIRYTIREHPAQAKAVGRYLRYHLAETRRQA